MNKSVRYQQAHRKGFWLGVLIAFSFIVGWMSGCTDRDAKAADEFAHRPSEKPAADATPAPAQDVGSWYTVHANGSCGKSESPAEMMETISTNGFHPQFSQDVDFVLVWYSVPATDMRYTYTYYRQLKWCQAVLDRAHYVPAELR